VVLIGISRNNGRHQLSVESILFQKKGAIKELLRKKRKMEQSSVAWVEVFKRSSRQKNMKNKALKIVAGFVVVIIAAILVITLSLDGMIRSGIEENGSELLQTQVTVDNVSVSIFSGSGTISGFTVQNPEGFSNEPALYIQEASMNMDIWSLFSDQIVVNEIIVKSPDLFFEQIGVGVNLKKLNDNMDLASEESSETSLIIQYLLIEDGNITVSSSLERERTTEVTLDEFTLNDIGRDGTNTIKQSVRQVLNPLLQKAMAEALRSGVVEQLENKVKNLFDN
jgi:hypothetical protein